MRDEIIRAGQRRLDHTIARACGFTVAVIPTDRGPAYQLAYPHTYPWPRYESTPFPPIVSSEREAWRACPDFSRDPRKLAWATRHVTAEPIRAAS